MSVQTVHAVSPDEPSLAKSQHVLEIATTNGPRVRFSRPPDDDTDIPAAIYIRRDDWVDMGEPDVITVTIEPGDRLNE